MYDLAFASGTNVFASVGADGSVRMFDLRSLEHSTIIYESCDGQGGSPVPLIRLAWNKMCVAAAHCIRPSPLSPLIGTHSTHTARHTYR